MHTVVLPSEAVDDRSRMRVVAFVQEAADGPVLVPRRCRSRHEPGIFVPCSVVALGQLVRMLPWLVAMGCGNADHALLHRSGTCVFLTRKERRFWATCAVSRARCCWCSPRTARCA